MISASHAAKTIHQGRVVAFPTESFYALGVDATNPKAIKKLFQLKKREAGKPIALIAASLAQVEKFFYLSSVEIKVAKKYWPGPLTLLLQPKVPVEKSLPEDDKHFVATKALGVVPPKVKVKDRGVVGGLLDSIEKKNLPRPVLVGVRVPSHARARRLAALAGVPITATSANVSGRKPTKSPNRIQQVFPGVPIMTGVCGKQTQPSTVAEILDREVKIHRPGAVKII